MATDPLALFDDWFAEAQHNEPNEPNAMALATTASFTAGGTYTLRLTASDEPPAKLSACHKAKPPPTE